MDAATETALVNAALTVLPQIIALIQASHSQSNPSTEPVDNTAALAALQTVITQTIAKDDLWLKDHQG